MKFIAHPFYKDNVEAELFNHTKAIGIAKCSCCGKRAGAANNGNISILADGLVG